MIILPLYLFAAVLGWAIGFIIVATIKNLLR